MSKQKELCCLCSHFNSFNNPKILALLETRISYSKAKAIFQAIGFTTQVLEVGDGFLGGKQLAWKHQKITIELKIKNFQFLHTFVKPTCGASWFFTIIYANVEVGMKT